ncbi:amidohydrolase family protein, partial [Nonomuraea sp. NPDC059022]|uniref:amidohydrolase family protein n=1 Tax=Nonomuraea sp. NPDC059022 TaxID=3346705 RepID=UPI0036C43A55
RAAPGPPPPAGPGVPGGGGGGGGARPPPPPPDSPWSDPVQFTTVARRHPHVPLLLGHAGLWPYGFARAAELIHGHPNLYLEICGSKMTGRWIAKLAALAGADRVVYGSDSCFLDLRVGFGRVALAPVSDADRALIQGGNLARVLKGRLA